MKKWLIRLAWATFLICTIVLMGASLVAQLKNELEKPEIVIHVSGENAFLTEHELYTRIKRKGLIYNGQKQEDLKVSKIEQYIKSMTEVRSVKVFTKIGPGWKIDVTLRKPIARVFNQYGESFYLDDEGVVMNTSTLHTARVVVVSGHIKDKITPLSVNDIINNDSLKSIRMLDDVYRISNYVCNDPLLQVLIGQIHLRKGGDFILIPLIGGQQIIFGSARTEQEVREKFEKLKIFYKEAVPYEGWNKYSEINLKYDNQIVGKQAKTY